MTGAARALLAVAVALPVLVGFVTVTVVTALAAALPQPFWGAGGDQGGDQVPSTAAPPGSGSTPGRSAGDIPPDMLSLYRAAAPSCPGLDWSILAGIGSVETDHGRSRLPGVHSGENQAGAAGDMQFLDDTFRAVVARHPPPPGGAHPPSRYNPHDAVFAAAAYLCDSGARTTGAPASPAALHKALFTYNRSDAYVAEVLDRAASYRR